MLCSSLQISLPLFPLLFFFFFFHTFLYLFAQSSSQTPPSSLPQLNSMELLQELLLTALTAVVFSFLIAKLVSMAMDSSRNPQLSHTQKFVGDTTEEDIQYHHRLQVDRFKSENKVQFVAEEAQIVDQFLEGSVDSSVKIDRAIEEEEDECCEELPRKSIEEIPEIIDEFQRSTVDEKEIEVVDNLLEENLKIGVEKDVVEEESEAIVSEADEKQIKIDSDDDDDWEGIERSELENIFAEATKFMEDEDLTSTGSDVQMELYGLHKVATEGPCREQAPMPLKVTARAKCDGEHWLHYARNAWQRLGNMSPEVAMEQYVALVSDNVPTWKEDKFVGVGKPDPLEVETTEKSKDAEDIPSTAKDDLTGGPILESLGKE